MGGAAIGATVSTLSYLGGHLIKYKSFKCVTAKDLAIVAGIGFVAGLFATDTFGASLAVGASANAAQYAALQAANDRSITVSGVIGNGAAGALGGALSSAAKGATANTIENIARGPSRINYPTSNVDDAIDAIPRNLASGYAGNADPDCGCQ